MFDMKVKITDKILWINFMCNFIMNIIYKKFHSHFYSHTKLTLSDNFLAAIKSSIICDLIQNL